MARESQQRCSAHLERQMVEYLKTQSLHTVPAVNMATSPHDRTLHTYVFVSCRPCKHDERTDASTGASDHLCVIRAATETEQRLSWPALSPLSPTYPLLRAFWMPIAHLPRVLFMIEHQQWASLERQHGIVVSEHDPLVWHRRNCADVFLCFKENLLQTFRFWTQATRPSRRCGGGRSGIHVFHKNETHRWGFVCRYEMKGHPDYQGDFSFFAVREPWRPPTAADDKHQARLRSARCECALDSNLVLERYVKSPSGVYEMCRELQSCPSGENVYVAADKTSYARGELCASVSVEADVDGLWLGPKRSVPTAPRVFVGTHTLIELFERVVLGDDDGDGDGGALRVDPVERTVYAECLRGGRTTVCRADHLPAVLIVGMACLCRVRRSAFRAVVHFMFETGGGEESHRWFLFRTHESIHRGCFGRAAERLTRTYGRWDARPGRKRQQMERVSCDDWDIKRVCFDQSPFDSAAARESAFSQNAFLSSLHLMPQQQQEQERRPSRPRQSLPLLLRRSPRLRSRTHAEEEENEERWRQQQGPGRQ